MAFDTLLAEKISLDLFDKKISFIEKKMFGGLAFMISDKMCIGIIKDQMMLRVLEEHYASLIEENNINPMNFTGKTMKGFLFIDKEAYADENKFQKFITLGLEFAEKGIVKSKS